MSPWSSEWGIVALAAMALIVMLGIGAAWVRADAARERRRRIAERESAREEAAQRAAERVAESTALDAIVLASDTPRLLVRADPPAVMLRRGGTEIELVSCTSWHEAQWIAGLLAGRDEVTPNA